MARRGHLHTGYSSYTSGGQGWADPFEPIWSWLDVADMDTWRWEAQAACHDIDPEIFFRNERQYNRRFLTTLCHGCAVEQQCLQIALERGERGWWGGTSEEDRKAIRKATA